MFPHITVNGALDYNKFRSQVRTSVVYKYPIGTAPFRLTAQGSYAHRTCWEETCGSIVRFDNYGTRQLAKIRTQLLTVRSFREWNFMFQPIHHGVLCTTAHCPLRKKNEGNMR